jgi:hypothetical protein
MRWGGDFLKSPADTDSHGPTRTLTDAHIGIVSLCKSVLVRVGPCE